MPRSCNWQRVIYAGVHAIIGIAKLAIYSHTWIWHYVNQETQRRAFEQLYFVGQHERQLIMYLLDICMSYSTYLVIFTAHNFSRKALNFP